MFRELTDHFLASPQIGLDDIELARDQGVTAIVNNRPDGEEPGAPQSADVEAAATQAGLDYHYIPVTHAGFSVAQIEALDTVLDAHGDGKILGYCRSGTRSTLLWALASARRGEAPESLSETAMQAGYDLTPIRMMIDTLYARS